MKSILVIISLLIFNSLMAQDSLRYYKLHELKSAPIDSVYAIDLSKMNLTEIPAIIYQFSNLRNLNLGKNKLTKVDSLHLFQHLQTLNLEKNKLEYFPIGICQLSKLENLIINRNNISSIPECIEYCQNLGYLDLWSTSVTALPGQMGQMKQLQKIDFSSIMLNKTKQQRLKDLLPHVQLVLDPPCACLD